LALGIHGKLRSKNKEYLSTKEAESKDMYASKTTD